MGLQISRTSHRVSTAVGLIALVLATALGLWVVLRPGPAAPQAVPGPPASLSSGPSTVPASTPVAVDPSPSTSATPGAGTPEGIPTEYPTPFSLPTPTGLPSDSAEPGSTEPSSTASAPTGDQEPPLVDNALYRTTVKPTSCDQPPQPAPRTEAGYRAFLERTFDCLQDLYAPALKKAHATLTTPYLVFYTDPAETPCGRSPSELSVFYCSANETVYATVSGLNDFTRMRLGLYYVVFHEYAHHVQERVGILDAARFRHEGWPQISRRIELQAECMMGVALHTVRSTQFSAADRAQLIAWRSHVPDAAHGTSAAQIAWIERGLATRSLGACNTWSAPTAQVA